MKNSNSDLGQYLRSLRILQNLTLHQISKEVDIDSPMLSKIERGERLPTLDQLKRLCNYYKLAEDDLRILHIAEKIIKEFGINNTTYEAVRLVEEQLTSLIIKNK